MADDDDLPTTTFPTGYTFQWVRVVGGTDTNIAGATMRTYTPGPDDVGHPLKVEVSFIDGGGTGETLASAATAAVVVAAENCAADRPDSEWCTTLTVEESQAGSGTNYGFRNNDYGALDDPDFDLGPESYTVQGLWIWDADAGSDGVVIDFSASPGRVPHGPVFNFGGTTFTANAASEHSSENTRYRWDRPADFEWLVDQKVTVSANLAPALTGATVDGDALVLTYHEDLDAGSTPAAGAYSVAVDGGAGAAPSSVSVSGATVTLTLASAVAHDDLVSVSYDPDAAPGSDPLRDASGLAALELIEHGVTNNTPAPVQVSIVAEHDVIGARLEHLEFTLTRGGATTAPLEATVILSQDQAWLDPAFLTHTVVFGVGDSQATMELQAGWFSFAPEDTGDLTASVSGAGIDGGSETVQVVSTAAPPFTVSLDQASYTFAENAPDADVVIELVATLDAAYPRAPSAVVVTSSTFSLSAASRPGDTASGVDYVSVSKQVALSDFTFERSVDTDPHVARLRLQDFGFEIRDDRVDEDDETLSVFIEQAPGITYGVIQVERPDGSTCVLEVGPSGCAHPAGVWPVTITDDDAAPVLALTAAPAQIAEVDGGGMENVATVTVASANGTIFAGDQVLTLTFAGTAVLDTDYTVDPGDEDSNAPGHQVTYPGEGSLIQALKDAFADWRAELPLEAPALEVTVTALDNTDVDLVRTVEVSGALDGTPFGTAATVTIADDEDNTAPTVSAIERQTPATSPTSADSLTWRVTFSENVNNVDAADFAVDGTTATLAVSTVTASTVYDVTATGGDLAGLDATVTLSFASGQDIADTVGNALADTAPTGADDATYVVDNTAPTVTITGVPETSDAAFTATFTFSETVTGFAAEDIEVGNGTAAAFAETTAGTVFTAQITPAANGQVTVDVAADAAEDAAGNGSTAATQATSTYTAPAEDSTAPTASSATVDGAVLAITFDEALAAAPGLANDAFEVKKTPQGGSEADVALSGVPAIVDTTVDAGAGPGGCVHRRGDGALHEAGLGHGQPARGCLRQRGGDLRPAPGGDQQHQQRPDGGGQRRDDERGHGLRIRRVGLRLLGQGQRRPAGERQGRLAAGVGHGEPVARRDRDCRG